jgi:peroxiredoxin
MVYCLFAAAAQAQFSGSFKINGTLKDIADVDKVLIRYRSVEGQRVDTIKPDHGKYSFTCQIAEPHLIQIWILHPPVNEAGRLKTVKPYDVATLYINPGTIEAVSTGAFKNMEASGTGLKWNKDYLYLVKEQKLRSESQAKYLKEIDSIKARVKAYTGPTASYSTADKNKDSALVATYEDGYLAFNKRLAENVLVPYIKANPGSPLSLYAVKLFAGDRIDDYQGTMALYESLLAEVKQMPMAKPFLDAMKKIAITSAGELAPVFTLPDTLGKLVSLESFRGKYVLIDFWASWCGPCRDFSPHVLKLYNEFKDKGFTPLGVSIDNESRGGMRGWKKAIIDDGLTWPQVQDAKGKISAMYHVQNIPQNFLIDPQGKIIGKNLGKEELEVKLKALLK